MTQKKLREILRREYFQKMVESFEQLGEEVLIIGENTLCIPCLNKEGMEEFVKVVVSVPIGTKTDIFDGYALEEDYKFKLEEKRKKEEKKILEKQKKIEHDKRIREQKKLIQEKREG